MGIFVDLVSCESFKLHGQVRSFRPYQFLLLIPDKDTPFPPSWLTFPRRCVPMTRGAAPSPSRGCCRPPWLWSTCWSVIQYFVDNDNLNFIQAAPLFGYLGDRYSRKLLVIVGIVLWASFSLASSFMPSYMPYLFVRAMLSIGKYSISF